jgi:hypothetical protein
MLLLVSTLPHKCSGVCGCIKMRSLATHELLRKGLLKNNARITILESFDEHALPLAPCIESQAQHAMRALVASGRRKNNLDQASQRLHRAGLQSCLHLTTSEMKLKSQQST